MAPVALRVRVRGLVQGVGFRAWTEKRARGLGLAGWVRNRSDGSVEALIAGDEAAINQMLGLLRRGPQSGRVDDMVSEAADLPAEAGFRTLPTA